MEGNDQEQRRRELERRMAELDELDRRYGLGADPRRYGSSPSEPPAGRPLAGGRGPMRRRPTRLRAMVSLVVALVLLAVVPGQRNAELRHLLHLSGDGATGPTGAGAYAFLRTQPDGQPVTYDHCRPIHYVINVENAPWHYFDVIRGAVAEAARRSGFRFVYDGSTSARDFDRSSGPVLIGFVSDDELRRLDKGDHDAIGVGGSTAVSLGNGYWADLTGMVALKASWFKAEDDHGRTALEQAVVMHELGHVLGLAHVQDPRQIMYPSASVARTAYGAGDIAGLARLGAARCG